jgi:hypothetical protein
MAGLSLQAIHEALADQIRAGIDRQTSVSAFPDGSTVFPSVTVHSDPGQYLNPYSTLGLSGTADISVRLKIEVDAVDIESACIKIADYLSMGSGNESSILDAILADETLGGLIEEMIHAPIEWDTETNPFVAYIPLQLIVKKVV